MNGSIAYEIGALTVLKPGDVVERIFQSKNNSLDRKEEAPWKWDAEVLKIDGVAGTITCGIIIDTYRELTYDLLTGKIIYPEGTKIDDCDDFIRLKTHQ